MLGKRVLEKHGQLVDRMASALGLDLETEHLRGTFPSEERDAAVLACTACDRSEGCEKWLMDFDVPQEGTPGFCRNRARFSALKSPR